MADVPTLLGRPTWMGLPIWSLPWQTPFRIDQIDDHSWTVVWQWDITEMVTIDGMLIGPDDPPIYRKTNADATCIPGDTYSQSVEIRT